MYLSIFSVVLSMASAIPTDSPSSPFKRNVANCPLYLTPGNYDFPHLIVPISAASPDAAMGNTWTPAISPNDMATVFNFDVPASRTGGTCNLYFSLPTQSQPVTTSFTFTGPGTLQLVQYQQNTGATAQSTWNSQPALSGAAAVIMSQVTPGHSYKIWSGDCGQGGLMSWRMSSVDSCLWWFQDYNDCAIGMYLVYG